MKFESFVILFSVFVLSFSEETEDLTEQEKCMQQYRALSQKCYKAISNVEAIEIIHLFNETVYTNSNEASVKAWTTQVCEFGGKATSCLAETNNAILPKCMKYNFIRESVINADMIRNVYNYFCANDGKRLIEIAENDGYKCLVYSSDFDDCNNSFKKERLAVDKDDYFELNPNYCGSFEKFKECIVEKLSDCPNQKIPLEAGELFAQVKTAIPCDG